MSSMSASLARMWMSTEPAWGVVTLASVTPSTARATDSYHGPESPTAKRSGAFAMRSRYGSSCSSARRGRPQ